jgi:hypothetical protein
MIKKKKSNMIHQKLLQSLAKRGVAGTIMKAGTHTLELLRWHVDARCDRYHRVDTSGKTSLGGLRIDSTNAPEGIWYEPVPTSCFRQLMGELAINFVQYSRDYNAKVENVSSSWPCFNTVIS